MTILPLKKHLVADDAESAGKVSFKKIALFVGLAAPVVLFVLLFVSFATNFPFSDDFDMVGFYLEFDRKDAYGKLESLFRQHNEHRIVYTRVMVLALTFLLGKVNVTAWMALGNLSLFVTCFLLYRSFRRDDKYKIVFFMPAVWFLFAPFYHNNVFWGMSALQNTSVVLFSLLAIYLVAQRTTASFYGAIPCAIVAVYTSGSGMFAAFVGVVILLYQRRYKALAGYVLVMLPAIGLYFFDYHAPEHHPPVIKSLSEYPEATFAGFFAFLGNAVKLTHTSYQFLIILLAGLVLFVYALHLLRQQYYAKNIVLAGMLLYVMLVGVSVSLGRAGFGAATLADSRFSIYSVVLICLLYLAAIESAGENAAKYLFRSVLCFSLLFSYRGFRDARDYGNWFRKYLLQNARDWEAGQPVETFHHPEEAARMLRTLAQENRYSPVNTGQKRP